MSYYPLERNPIFFLRNLPPPLVERIFITCLYIFSDELPQVNHLDNNN